VNFPGNRFHIGARLADDNGAAWRCRRPPDELLHAANCSGTAAELDWQEASIDNC
jgi:hypothetical protein